MNIFLDIVLGHFDFQQLLLLLSALFFCLSVLYLLIILSKEKGRKKNESIRDTYWSDIQRNLALISIAPDENAPVAALAVLSKKSKKIRQWILDEIVSQMANLSGESKSNLLRVYKVLGLKDCSLRKLKSARWHVVAKGIQELEAMEQKACVSEIRGFLNSNNRELRKTARLALTSLSEQPLTFLNEVQEEMSEWERMSIHFRLLSRSKDELPDFSIFYAHSELSVVKLCINLSVYFNCFEHIPKLIELLSSESNELLVEVIDALTKLEAFQAIESVTALMTPTQDVEVLTASLDFLGSLGDDECQCGIERFIDHRNAEVRMAAVKSAIALNLDYKDHSNDIKRMYAHHLNELIS